jgi:hypothetical protein
MWSRISAAAIAKPNQIMALAVFIPAASHEGAKNNQPSVKIPSFPTTRRRAAMALPSVIGMGAPNAGATVSFVSIRD